MSTSVVHRITVIDAADYATTLAALAAVVPEPGSNLTAAQIRAAEETAICIGSKARGDDADLDSESVDITPIHEGVTIRAPGALTATGYVQRHNGIEEIVFTCYDLASKLFDLDSSIVDTDGTRERTATVTNRAVLLERDGILFEGYPSVVLHITEQSGGFGPGDDAVSKLQFTGRVLGTTEVPSGQQIVHYVVGT